MWSIGRHIKTAGKGCIYRLEFDGLSARVCVEVWSCGNGEWDL